MLTFVYFQNVFGDPTIDVVKSPNQILARALKTFEPPRPREVTFGIAARLFEHSDLRNSQELHRYLHGYATTELASRIPGGLAVLFRRMAGYWSEPRQVLMQHTIWPALRVFQESQDGARRTEDLLIRSRRNPGQKLRHLVTLERPVNIKREIRAILSRWEVAQSAAGSHQDPSLAARGACIGDLQLLLEYEQKDSWDKRFLPRYCIECALEDLRSGIAATWYRDHQLPELAWCAKHKSKLLDYCVGCGETLFRHSYVLPPFHERCRGKALRQLGVDRPGRARFPRRGTHKLSAENRHEREELRIAEFAVSLMGMNLPPIPFNHWQQAVQIGMEKRGLAASLRRMRQGNPAGAASGDVFMGTTIPALRELARPGDRKALFPLLSPKAKLLLSSAVFDSAGDFVAILQSVTNNWTD